MHLTVYKGADVWLEAYTEIVSGQDALGFDQTLKWFEAYVMHVLEQPESSLMVAVVDDISNHLLLGMPLLSSAPSRLPVRYLSALANYYTSLFQPVSLTSQHSLEEMVSCFVSALGDGLPKWDEMSLEPMARDTVFFRQFCCSLDAYRYPYAVTECFTNWYLEVNGQSYEAYEQSLPAKLRNTLRRKQRKLAREFKSTLHIVHDDSDLDRFIHDYEVVYQKSWKSEESHPAFIRAIIQRFAKQGWLKLGLMYIDDKPVAAQLWFVKEGIASIYKLSYDKAYAKYSVGTILTAALMRQVIDIDRVKLIDFLTGDDAYKRDWMSHRRKRYRIRIYNRDTWRGRVLAFWNLKVKNVLRKA